MSRVNSSRIQEDNSTGAGYWVVLTDRRLAYQIMGVIVCHQWINISRGRQMSVIDQRSTLLAGYTAFVQTLIASNGTFQMSGRPCTVIQDSKL